MIDRMELVAMASVVIAGDETVAPAVPVPAWFAELVRNSVCDRTDSYDDHEGRGLITTVDDVGIARDLWAALADKLADAAPTHRHVARGSEYRVTSTGGQVQTSRPIVEGDRLTTYVAADGTVWHRLDEEFNDGRFVEIGRGEATPASAKAPFRCGDIVHHAPDRCDLMVAWADAETGRFSWFGWPPGEGRIEDCTVVTALTDEEHVAEVRRVAALPDPDGRLAPLRRIYADIIAGGEHA